MSAISFNLNAVLGLALICLGVSTASASSSNPVTGKVVSVHKVAYFNVKAGSRHYGSQLNSHKHSQASRLKTKRCYGPRYGSKPISLYRDRYCESSADMPKSSSVHKVSEVII